MKVNKEDRELRQKFTTKEVYRETMHWLKVGAEMTGDGLSSEEIREIIDYHREILRQRELIDYCIHIATPKAELPELEIAKEIVEEPKIEPRMCKYCGERELKKSQLKFCSDECRIFWSRSDEGRAEASLRGKQKGEVDEARKAILGRPIVRAGKREPYTTILYEKPLTAILSRASKGRIRKDEITNIIKSYYPHIQSSTATQYMSAYQEYLYENGVFSHSAEPGSIVVDLDALMNFRSPETPEIIERALANRGDSKTEERIKGKRERWTIPNPEDLDYKIKVEGPQHGCRWCGNLNRQHRYAIKNGFMKCENCGRVHETEKRK